MLSCWDRLRPRESTHAEQEHTDYKRPLAHHISTRLPQPLHATTSMPHIHVSWVPCFHRILNCSVNSFLSKHVIISKFQIFFSRIVFKLIFILSSWFNLVITEEVVGEIKVLWGRGRGSGCRPLLKLIAEERKKTGQRRNNRIPRQTGNQNQNAGDRANVILFLILQMSLNIFYGILEDWTEQWENKMGIFIFVYFRAFYWLVFSTF